MEYNEFTNERIESAGAGNWSYAQVQELYRQKDVLMNRLRIAQFLGKVSMMNQLVYAISALDQQILVATAKPTTYKKKRRGPTDPSSNSTPSFD